MSLVGEGYGNFDIFFICFQIFLGLYITRFHNTRCDAFHLAASTVRTAVVC